MNQGNKKKMEMGGSFDEMLRAYELSLLDKSRVPDEEEIPSFSERTSDAFQLGEIVWDTENGEYGVVIGIFNENTGDEYEVRLDSSGMRPVDILRKRGELGDSGNAMDLLSAIVRYERLLNTFPENTDEYPQILNKPKMAKGGAIKGRNTKTGETFEVVIDSKKESDEVQNGVDINVQSRYSSRISERKLVFDSKGNLYSVLDYGYTLDGTLPPTSGGNGRTIGASNKKETINEMEGLGYNKGFANKVIKLVKQNDFAKGGTLELDPKQAKKAFHLPIEMAIYVPSTSDVDKAISDSEMKKRVTEVSTYLSNIFGGYTSQETIGGYVDSKGNLVNEDVVRVVSFGATEKFEKNKAKILNKIAEWCSKWSQEAIGFEVEGDLYYIPENFAKGGNVRKYANGGSTFYIPYTTEVSFKHKDDMDGIRRVSTFTKQIDSAITFEEARTIAEEAIDERLGYEGYEKDDISEIEIDDFYLGMPEEDDDKKFRGEVGIEENDEMLPEIERSGRWGDEYALLCDELANYKMGGRIKNALKNRFGKSKKGDVEIMGVEEIQESNNPQDMMQTLNYDPQMILSALKEAKDLAPETARSLDLYMASQIRNKQKFSDFLNTTPNELLGRRFAVGGEVEYVDVNELPSGTFKIWESRKSKNTGQSAIGSFAHKINKKLIGDYYLYLLDDDDEAYYSHIPLKTGEILARVETDNMVGGEMPLVKVNIDNGRVYFMSDDNDRFSDEDEKNPKFNRASADVTYLSLDKQILKYVGSKQKFALGGYIKNKIRDDVFLLTSKKYIKDGDTYDTRTYYRNETEILSKRLANRLVQILKERNITPSNIVDGSFIQEIEYKIPLTDGSDGFTLLTLKSHSINKRLSQISLDYRLEDWNDKYGFRNLFAKGGDVKEDVLEVSNQLANASKMHKQQSQELKRLSKKMAKGGEVDMENYKLPQSLKERKRDFDIIDNRGEKEGLEIYEDGSGKWYVENKKTGLIADFRTKAEAQEGIINPDWDYGEGEPIIAE